MKNAYTKGGALTIGGFVTHSTDWNVIVQYDLDNLEDVWTHLYSKHSASVFQHFSLQKLFFNAVAENQLAVPFVVLAYTQTGELAGILPFTKFKKGSLWWIASADHGMLDTCQPILSPTLVDGHNIGPLMIAVKQALPPADVIYFNKLPAKLAETANVMLSLPNIALLPMSKWPVDLSKGYEAHKATNTSKKFRSWIRQHIRKTEKKYKRTFELFVGDEVTEEVYGRIQEMRATFFEREGRENHLENPAWSGFYKHLATDFKKSLKSWVCFLSLDNQPAAAVLGLLEEDYVICLIVATNTRDFAVYSCGGQLSEKIMQLFEQRGIRTVDWSVGDWDYKRRFGAEKVRLYDFMMPKSFVGWGYFLFWRLKSWLRNTKYRDFLIKFRSFLSRS